MSLRSGLAAQFGIAEEATFATFKTPTRFLEFESESMTLAEERIESAGLRAGQSVQRADRWKANRKGAEGDVSLPVMSTGFGLLFEHLLGTNTTANPGTSAYTHTATLGDTAGKSLTVQVGKPDSGGTVRSHSYVGAKVASWEISCEVDGILMVTPTFDAVDEETDESLASASYSSDDELLVFTNASVTIGGTAVPVKRFSVSGDNAIATDRYFLRDSGLKKEQYIAGMREITGELVLDFEDFTEYDYFRDGTEIAIVATFEGESLIETGYLPHVEITLPSCRVDGDTPTVGGPEMLELSLPFKVTDDGSNEPISIEYQTSDSSA